MKIIFTKEAWYKINLYIQHTPGEISGLGVGKLAEDHSHILVTDIGLWKQECTGSETEVISHDEMIALATELIDRGNKPEDINIWWHSHANMSVFWSTTDNTTIENWVNNRFLLAIVGNKKTEFLAKLAVKDSIFPSQFDNLPISVEPDYYPAGLEEAIVAEVKEKVTVKTYAPAPKYNNYAGQTYKQFKKNKKLAHLPPDEQNEGLLEFASQCLCDECWEFVTGNLTAFPFNSHNWDKKEERWIPKLLEQRQLSKQRVNDPSIEELLKNDIKI